MADLYSSTYNPDVLSCIANLSNDEVFTPPTVANAMLDMLPQELFSNPNTTFLDPACKSGVFLREIAKRLNDGLVDVIPDLQERLDHIFHKQLFGIAITEITSLLSRRSVYCSKYPNSIYSVSKFDDIQGNIRFKNVQHRWQKGKCVFCGASESEYGDKKREDLETHAYELIHTTRPEEIFNMKFDVIIGNPPYQMSDGGAQASAKPIYNYFIEQAKKLNPRYLTMIIPARWYAGGKGLDVFRNSMLNDRHLKELHDFIDASELFTGVEIKGGICYFLWDRDNPGDCLVCTHENGKIISQMSRPLLEEGVDTFIRSNEAISILHKIRANNEESFSKYVNPAMTFGFRTYFKEFDSQKNGTGLTKVYANHSQGYIKTSRIERGTEFINSWKVLVPEAVGSGDSRTDVLKPILSEPNSICTETYIMNGPWDNENIAQNVCSYIETKFFHFLLGLKKITQHTTGKTYEFIPMQEFKKKWTDSELYKKYELDETEISFIENSIWPEK